MASALLVRLRPAGPWRLGPDNGAKNSTGRVFHSDALYSAITIAMRELGWLDAWIAATAGSSEPAVRLSSCYPFTGRTLLIQPPRSLWPVRQTGMLRWKAARFVPTSVISTLLKEEDLKEGQWAVDPISECLLPMAKHGPLQPPFRLVRRTFGAVDRMTGSGDSVHEAAGLQFAPGAGMWFVAAFASDAARETWSGRLRGVCRLIADTGVGGLRSKGWGRSEEPRFEGVQDLTRMLTGTPETAGAETAWWLVSLFSPADSDTVDWKRGNYGVSVRAGRVESPAQWGELKPAARMISEGSVLLGGTPPTGTARNVATAEFPHAVYRSGIALAIPIPWKESRKTPWMVAEEAAEAEVQEPEVQEPEVQEPEVQEPEVQEPEVPLTETPPEEEIVSVAAEPFEPAEPAPGAELAPEPDDSAAADTTEEQPS